MGDLRAVFMNKEVRESIYDYHGEETYTALLERIEMLAAGGQSMIARDVFVDHLRKTFTIAKLSFNWGVFLKQLTSLPAYAFDMPVKEFLKYEAEFFSSPVENWKKMWSLEYNKNRFDEGYDRDVMLVLSDLAANKSKLAKLAEFGMISGRAGDIMPVIVGGFAVYSHAKAKALAEKKSESEAEALAVLEFEMVTDRAQQSGNLKDQSHYGLQGSFMRVLTMFQTSPRQYYLNMAEAIGDARAGRKGGAQKAAKAAVIAQVVLPSLFYWTSAFTRNLFKDDEEEEDLDELLKGWGASMLLGPFSGIFLWGQIGSELTSGYDYRLPVIEWGGGIGDGVDKLAKMWGKKHDDDDETNVTAEDVVFFLDSLATSGSLLVGGAATWYDISTRAGKSFGVSKDDVKDLMKSDQELIADHARDVHKKIYEESIGSSKDEGYKDKAKARWQELADAYEEIRDKNPDDWAEISEGLKKDNKFPEKVSKLMER